MIPVPQAITFTPPTLGIAGQSATLSATGGASGNPVVFSVDPSSGAGVCSVSGADGTTLDYAQPGTCVIDANQDGNASYAAAPTVTATITVDQEPAFTADSPPDDGDGGTGLHVHLRGQRRPGADVRARGGRPSWLTIDATTGALSGTPPTGTTSFTYSVAATNGVGDPTAGPFAVTVNPGVTNSRDADISAALSCPDTVPAWTVDSCSLKVANAGPAWAHFVTADVLLPRTFWRALRVWRWPVVRQRGALVGGLPRPRLVGHLHRALPGQQAGPSIRGRRRALGGPGSELRQQRGGGADRRDPLITRPAHATRIGHLYGKGTTLRTMRLGPAQPPRADRHRNVH